MREPWRQGSKNCLTGGKEGSRDRICEPLHVQGCKKIERNEKKINRYAGAVLRDGLQF
jgi:hypothetical protein